jgi:hypothetical protein
MGRLLLLFEGGAAALHRTAATLGNDYLGPALAADVNLSKLIRHLCYLLLDISVYTNNEFSQAPLKSGLRFSKKARTPSARSAVVCSRA